MVPRGSGVPPVHMGSPGRSGGVSIRVAITVLAGLWEVQREAREIVLEKIGVIIVVRVYRRGGGTGGFGSSRSPKGPPGGAS